MYAIRSVFLLLLLSVFQVSLYSQQEQQQLGSPSIIWKYSPVSLFDFYNPTIMQVGLEHRLTKRSYLEHEAGLITAYRADNSFNGNPQGITKLGWRFQEEWRLYLGESLRQGIGNGYFSLLASWRYSSFEDWITFFSGDGNFFRTQKVKIEDELAVIAPGFGLQLLWDKLLTVDMSIHAGVAYKKRSNDAFQDSDVFFFDDNWGAFPSAFTIRTPTERLAPHLILSLKLGFITKRK